MAGTYQEQIDDLRKQIANLQSDINLRAKKTYINTINQEITSDQTTIDNKLADLEECVSELLNDIIDAREELRTHTH